jgi:stearoyl-CoA desaturase (delta-9 desaturase)
MLSFGEGWHNNHHAHPTSARHGLAWYEFDISWISIQMLKFFGLAKAIRVAKVNSVVAEREAA